MVTQTPAVLCASILWKPDSIFANYNFTRCISGNFFRRDFSVFQACFCGPSVFMAPTTVVFQRDATAEYMKVCFCLEIKGCFVR